MNALNCRSMKENNRHRDNQEASYEALSKIYTDEELAESFVFPSSLTEKERRKAHEEFLRLRQQQLNNLTDEEEVSC